MKGLHRGQVALIGLAALPTTKQAAEEMQARAYRQPELTIPLIAYFTGQTGIQARSAVAETGTFAPNTINYAEIARLEKAASGPRDEARFSDRCFRQRIWFACPVSREPVLSM